MAPDRPWTCRSIPSSLVSLSCRERHMRTRFVIVSIALVWFAAAAAAAQSRVAWVRQSDIIFAGTVTRAGLVRVDQVFEKPEAVSLVKGDSVTVLPARAGSLPLNPGMQAPFYTTGWIYGRSINVRDVGRGSRGATPAHGIRHPRRAGAAQALHRARSQLAGSDHSRGRGAQRCD